MFGWSRIAESSSSVNTYDLYSDLTLSLDAFNTEFAWLGPSSLSTTLRPNDDPNVLIKPCSSIWFSSGLESIGKSPASFGPKSRLSTSLWSANFSKLPSREKSKSLPEISPEKFSIEVNF